MTAGTGSGPVEILDLEDPGLKFSELPRDVQDGLLSVLDELVRPTVLGLARALAATTKPLRACRAGTIEALQSLADGEVIPYKGRDSGPKPLSRERWLAIIAMLHEVNHQQFGEAQQDLLADVCGAMNF